MDITISAKVTPVEAMRPLALALDVGTSSVRAVLYDSSARMIDGIEGRTQYRMNATVDGGVEIPADRLVELICGTIDQCLAEAAAVLPDIDDAICCVGYSNFWHAMMGIDQHGRAATPLFNWNDTRSAPDARKLAELFGADWIHQRTGVVPHASYYPAKLLWLRRTQPELFDGVKRWISIGEYLYSIIFGRLECGISMASGTGLFNPNLNRWDDEILAALDLREHQLSPLSVDDGGFREMNRQFADRWPALRGATWLPAAGDGACSNIGSGCFSREMIAINIGTSGAMRVCWPVLEVRIPEGLWCYRANSRYALIGGALSNGGDVYAWCKRVLRAGIEGFDDEEDLERELASMDPDRHGLTVLPFFSGERSTGWHDFARASIIGLSLSTTPLDILRASLEAVSYRFAAIYSRISSELDERTRIIASGGAIVNSRFWTQMMADVIGVPVSASAVPEASSRGAAMLALEAFGRIENFSQLPTPLGESFQPDMARHADYLEARQRQDKYYNLLIANENELI